MLVQVLFWLAPLLFLSRRDHCFRIVALQHQLGVYQRQQGGRRLQLTDQDRRFWVMLLRRMATENPWNALLTLPLRAGSPS
jgi:hypothetical protein